MSIFSFFRTALKKSFRDTPSKAIYDTGKWLFITYVVSALTTIEPSMRKLLLQRIELPTVWLVLVVPLLLSITAICYKQRNTIRQLLIQIKQDDLTGLPTGNSILDKLTEVIEQSEKTKNIFSLILIDIDDFKSLNTKYSYDFANKVLVKVAKLLSSDCRVTDSLFRQFKKGDEFYIVAEMTNVIGARKAAERKKNAIESTIFEVDSVEVKITVSVGIIEYAEAANVESMMDRVEKALKKAKSHAGKSEIAVIS